METQKPVHTVYTPEQVAQIASCAVQTIYRRIEKGDFPNARRIGKRKWFLAEEDVIKYLGFNPKEVSFEIANVKSADS